LTTFDVRPVADTEEYKQAVWAIGQYFGPPANDERIERFQRLLPLERMHAAWEDGAIVGGAGAFGFRMSVPGGDVPCAGVSVVGVFPTHRRRGVLRAMMRAQLDDAHARGDAIAALWSSEETIYGRFGYGIASWGGNATLAREYGAFVRRHEPAGHMRFVDADEALELFPPVYEAVRAQRPGMFQRTPDWWRDRTLADPEDRREGAGPKRYVVHETDGDVTGYAMYRHKPGFDGGISTATLSVVEAMGTRAEATRDVWRYLLDIDWSATVDIWMLPIDHPLFLLLASPRRARFRVGDVLWVRVVDVGAALSSRSYRDGEPIVFDVRDSFCEWNEGAWKLEDGKAERTTDEPEIRLDADALGSAYLGGVSFAQLQRALRLEELSGGAVCRADDLFRTSAHPWCPEIF
jgi:predicted acetyltransferase